MVIAHLEHKVDLLGRRVVLLGRRVDLLGQKVVLLEHRVEEHFGSKVADLLENKVELLVCMLVVRPEP